MAAQAQVKKEQHNKSRQQQNQDGDPEAPQLDELIPEKLSRTDIPLEKAIDFLKPLQLLAKDNIETHLMAFEIYYRKNKLLLMLQSLKRAVKIDPNHPIVHSCIIKYQKSLNEMQNDMDENVKNVINIEANTLFKGKQRPNELNEFYLEQNKNSFDSVIEVAKSMYILDNGKKQDAIKLITSFSSDKLKLKASSNYRL